MRPAVPESTKRNHLPWIGVVVTLAGALSYFAFFARFPATRDVPVVNLPVVLAGALVTGLGLVRSWRRSGPLWRKGLSAVAMGVSGLLAAGFLFYVYGLSYRLPPETGRTAGLDAAPDVALTATDGRTVRLADWRGRRVVLVFYRGYW